MNDIEMLNAIRNFPIGEIPKTRSEWLSKAEVISFLARTQEQFSLVDSIDERELIVKEFLGETLALNDGEVMPSLNAAESTLKLSPGYIQDYGKIQYLKENNPNFNKTYDLIASNLELTKESSKKAR